MGHILSLPSKTKLARRKSTQASDASRRPRSVDILSASPTTQAMRTSMLSYTRRNAERNAYTFFSSSQDLFVHWAAKALQRAGHTGGAALGSLDLDTTANLAWIEVVKDNPAHRKFWDDAVLEIRHAMNFRSISPARVLELQGMPAHLEEYDGRSAWAVDVLLEIYREKLYAHQEADGTRMTYEARLEAARSADMRLMAIVAQHEDERHRQRVSQALAMPGVAIGAIIGDAFVSAIDLNDLFEHGFSGAEPSLTRSDRAASVYSRDGDEPGMLPFADLNRASSAHSRGGNAPGAQSLADHDPNWPFSSGDVNAPAREPSATFNQTSSLYSRDIDAPAREPSATLNPTPSLHCRDIEAPGAAPSATATFNPTSSLYSRAIDDTASLRSNSDDGPREVISAAATARLYCDLNMTPPVTPRAGGRHGPFQSSEASDVFYSLPHSNQDSMHTLAESLCTEPEGSLAVTQTATAEVITPVKARMVDLSPPNKT